MAKKTCIAWTNDTWNPWIGCSPVDEGCDNCYARELNKRRKWILANQWRTWGSRKVTRVNWSTLRSWDKTAKSTGERRKVIVGDLCDFFEENQHMRTFRAEVWKLLCECDGLDLQLCTKRPENVEPLLLSHECFTAWPSHIWLGVTVVNQRNVDERLPILRKIPAKVKFVLAQPLLERIDLGDHIGAVDQIIAGGESRQGENCRPMPPEWAREIRDLCERNDKSFFFEQWSDHESTSAVRMYRDAKVLGRRIEVAVLDGRSHTQIPGREQSDDQKFITRESSGHGIDVVRSILPDGSTVQYEVVPAYATWVEACDAIVELLELRRTLLQHTDPTIAEILFEAKVLWDREHVRGEKGDFVKRTSQQTGIPVSTIYRIIHVRRNVSTFQLKPDEAREMSQRDILQLTKNAQEPQPTQSSNAGESQDGEKRAHRKQQARHAKHSSAESIQAFVGQSQRIAVEGGNVTLTVTRVTATVEQVRNALKRAENAGVTEISLPNPTVTLDLDLTLK